MTPLAARDHRRRDECRARHVQPAHARAGIAGQRHQQVAFRRAVNLQHGAVAAAQQACRLHEAGDRMHSVHDVQRGDGLRRHLVSAARAVGVGGRRHQRGADIGPNGINPGIGGRGQGKGAGATQRGQGSGGLEAFYEAGEAAIGGQRIGDRALFAGRRYLRSQKRWWRKGNAGGEKPLTTEQHGSDFWKGGIMPGQTPVAGQVAGLQAARGLGMLGGPPK